MFSLFLIILLLLMSGLIAYLGDQLGTKVGKARISLFRLRPKDTAILISAFTGVVISALTLLILYLTFEDARIILTGLDRIKQEIKTVNEDLAKKNHELAQLEKEKVLLASDVSMLREEKDELQKTVEKYRKITRDLVAVRTGDLIFPTGEILVSVVIPGNQSQSALRESLNQILFNLDKGLKEKGAGNWRQSSQSFYIPRLQIDNAVKGMSGPKNHVLRILSASNVVKGEFVPIAFEIREVRTIYNKGNLILRKKISGSGGKPELEQELVLFLKEVNQEAVRKGMLPDNSGLVGTITTSSMYDVLTKLEQGARPAYLTAIAAKDTANSEALSVELNIEE